MRYTCDFLCNEKNHTINVDHKTIHEGCTNKITFTHKKIKSCIELTIKTKNFREI